MLGQRVEPPQLAGEILVPHRLAVRHVDRGEGQVAEDGTDHPRTVLFVAGQPALGHLERLAAEDRHAVPGLLAVARRGVAGGLELGVRELLVGQLELLQPHQVGLARAQPVQHEVEPRPQTVDVPTGDTHEDSRPAWPAVFHPASSRSWRSRAAPVRKKAWPNPLARRGEREVTERPDLLVKSLELPSDAVIADIGAGSGYFTFRLSPLVPEGKVLAVDIQPQMLREIEKRRDARGVTNVETVLGAVTDPNLPDGAVDAVLIIDAYHEFSHPREMMEAIFADLKPDGRLFLVEYRAEDPDVPILPLHKMTERQARTELQIVGLEWVENRPVLPQQHLMIFRRPPSNSDDRAR